MKKGESCFRRRRQLPLRTASRSRLADKSAEEKYDEKTLKQAEKDLAKAEKHEQKLEKEEHSAHSHHEKALKEEHKATVELNKVQASALRAPIVYQRQSLISAQSTRRF